MNSKNPQAEEDAVPHLPKKQVDLDIKTILPYLVLALLFTTGPYVVARLLAPQDMTFTGALVNHNDISSYTSAMRQGHAGYWLFHLPFSPEEWQPVLMLPTYMLLGKMTLPFGGSFQLPYDALRVIGIVASGVAVLVWVRRVIPGQPRIQLTSWLLIIFASGFSWLVWPLLAPLVDGVLFRLPDIGRSELSLLTIFFGPPHFSLGLALQIFFFLAVIEVSQPGARLAWIAVAALLGLLLASTYVYQIATVGLITGLYYLFLAVQRRKIPWRTWISGLLVLSPLLPLFYYYSFVVNLDPTWAGYVTSTENNIFPPPLWALAVGLGFSGLLAVLGLKGWLHGGYHPFVPIWIAGNLLAMYLPTVQYSGRFMLGLMVPIGTLAGFGMERSFLPFIGRRQIGGHSRVKLPSWRRITLLLTTPAALMIILVRLLAALHVQDYPFYLPTQEIRALTWLADEMEADDILLAHYPVSNYYPSIGPGRTYAGSIYLTPDLDGKLEELSSFWGGRMTLAERVTFLREWQIAYLYYGRFEQELAGANVEPLGELIYDENGVRIYSAAELWK